ncbi:winged helix-turn-helix domain-containing protein [uncultured Sphingomonas sp.]|uniref:winged helix-turn-helix domain-containing protein n=1 Tax=uncultured Sphingomonas sp. TaxID=158754 RepID=UPI0035CB4AB5
MVLDRDPGAKLEFGDFAIDRRDERLLGPTGAIRLGRKAYRLLLALTELEGRLLTKDALLSSVWDGTIVSEAALTSVVKELRRALNDDSRAPTYIETVYGRGYRLLTPVAAGETAAEDAPDQAQAAATSLKLGAPPILVVSAFDGQRVAVDHPDLAAQLREEVVSGLARFRELQLIADSRPDARLPDREDMRAYQLTAMVLPHGDGIKVIARLRRLADDVIVWTESVTADGSDMATGVEHIVRRIVGAALPIVDEDMVLETPRDAASVYGAYLSAKWISVHARGFSEAKDAAAKLEAIIAERPGFAPAYPALVRLYNTDYGYTGLGSTGSRERARALALAKAGLAADRANAHAHSVLGFCHLWHDDRVLARACFDRSLALNPYNHVRVQEAATAYMYLGEAVAARELMKRAMDLNPFTDDAYHEDFGRLLLIEGEYDAAHASLRAVLNGSIWPDLYLAVCEVELGIDRGRKRLSEWLSRVGRCWHVDAAPTLDQVRAWVRLHQPFSRGAGESFLARVDADLAVAAAHTSRASASR